MGNATILIREYDEQRHLPEVRNCVMELQDFERSFDPRMPGGAEIVDDYMLQTFHQCKESQGQVLVAEVDGDVVGYATVLSKVESEGVENGGLEYGLVADLVVKNQFRGRGIGKLLLDAAEQYARSHGVSWLRIGVLSGNQAAQGLYESSGFSNIYTELEKDLRRPR